METSDRTLDLAHIRGLMERSTRFLSLSGLSGICAGTLALLGAFIAQRYLHHHALSSYEPLDRYRYETGPYWEHIMVLGMLAMVILVLAVSGAAYFTWRRSRQLGQGLWDRSARRMLINLLIPLIAGGVFCMALLYHGFPGSVPAATLIFYGLSLLNASKYTLDEIRWLGLSEIVLGLCAAFWLGAGLLFWALGFGVLHIFYGTIMYMRHERNTVRQ